MPIYEYHCQKCGESQDRFNRIDDRESNAPICCGSKTDKVVTACMVAVQAECHYVCPVTSEKVTSYRQRANIMAREGLKDGNDYKPAEIISKKKKQTADRQALANQLTQIEGMSKQQVMEAVA